MPAPELDAPFVGVPEWLLRWQPPPEQGVNLTLADKLAWAALRDRVANIGPALSLSYLASFVGTSAKAVGRTLPKLEAAGLLRVERADNPLAGKRAERVNRYVVLKSNGAQTGTFDGRQRSQNGHVNVPGPDAERAQNGHVNVPGPDAERAQNGHVNGTVRAPYTEQREDRQQSGPAAGACTTEIPELLTGEEIDPKTAAAEAARPGATVELVRAALAWADDQTRLRNRPGFILAALRDRPPELLKRADAECQRAEAEALRNGAVASLERNRQTVAAISEAEWPAIVSEVCQRIRRRWPHAEPECEIERAGRSVEVLSPLLVGELAAAYRAHQDSGSSA